MLNIFNSRPRILLALCGAMFVPACAWGQTVTLTQAVAAATIPAQAKQEGPPLRDGERTLFRFRAPADATKVFLAGSFNDFANNQNGIITDEQFAMTKTGEGLFYTRAFVEPTTQKYKYVVLDKAGKFNWLSDPQVTNTDPDGNSVLDFSTLQRIPASATRVGKPVRDGEDVVFRFDAPSGTTKVFLAGSFNGYANNKDSIVTDEQFAMTRDKNGLYVKRVSIGNTTEKYKFVVVDKDGKTTWVSDPEVKATDDDGNTVLNFATIESVR